LCLSHDADVVAADAKEPVQGFLIALAGLTQKIGDGDSHFKLSEGVMEVI
jgi:hypothetical protein